MITTINYQYSLDGKQTAKTDKDGITTHYTYDLMERLIGEKQTVKGINDKGKEVDVETANISYHIWGLQKI